VRRGKVLILDTCAMDAFIIRTNGFGIAFLGLMAANGRDYNQIQLKHSLSVSASSALL
jgi:hypothetical protein